MGRREFIEKRRQFNTRNMNYVPTYNDSLRFNQYDLHVIVSGLFNNKEYFSAKVTNIFPVSKYKKFNFILLEVILLYKIGKKDGIFVKRHLQNYNNVHTVLVSHDVGIKIEELLRNIDRNKSVLISFRKLLMHEKYVKFDKNERRAYYFILPGSDIVATTSGLLIYYVPPTHFYCPEHEEIPFRFSETLTIRNFVYISELEWYVNDLRVVPSDRTPNTDQNAKSTDSIQKSVLGKKLNYTKVQLQKKSKPISKECVCFLKNQKPTACNSKNLPIKSQHLYVKTPEQINKEETLETLEVPEIIEVQELMPFRIIDEEIDTRSDVSHLYWIHR